MKWIWGTLVVTLCASAAAEQPGDFGYGVPLRIEGDAPLYEVEIPASVYRGVYRSDLGDLRVFNADGEPVPFAFEPTPGTQIERASPLAVSYLPLYGEQGTDLNALHLRVERAGNGTVVNIDDRPAGSRRRKIAGYVIDLSAAHKPYDALELDWRQDTPDFTGNVRLEGSNDLTRWYVVLAQAALVRLRNGERVIDHRLLEFGPTAFTYLRLSWPDGQPLELTSAAARGQSIVHEAQRVWMRVAGQVTGGAGEFSVDLDGQFPIDRLRVELPQPNSLAFVTLLSRSSAKQQWRTVASSVAFRQVGSDRREVLSPPLSVATDADRHWLIRVDMRGGGAGKGAPALSAGWLPQKLVFAARGPGPFQIAYGSAQAQPAAYPIEALLPQWHNRPKPEVALAQALPERTLAGRAAFAAKRDYKVWSLWAALVGAVALLAWMAWRLAKQMGPGGRDQAASPPAN